MGKINHSDDTEIKALNPGMSLPHMKITVVHRIKGAIGYVEYAYTMKTHLIYTRMKNEDGKTVTPNMSTSQAAAANADFRNTHDFYLILTEQPGSKSWLITAATDILMSKDTPCADNEKVLHFATWYLHHGQRYARRLNYVPRPKRTMSLIEHYWKQELGI